MLGFLLSEYPRDLIIWIFLYTNTNYDRVKLIPILSKSFSRKLFYFLCTYIFFIAVTPAAYILCLVVFQVCCHICTKSVQHWLPIVLIILSNDIHLNPGPDNKNNFNFMAWNLNSLAKDNFKRVGLIEAHNSIFNYDLISICETSLNDSVELPETLLN